MSRTSSKVTDHDLLLTYFTRSNKSLEGLLATYQLHKLPDQRLRGTIGASWKCHGHVRTSLTFDLYTWTHVQQRHLEGVLFFYDSDLLLQLAIVDFHFWMIFLQWSHIFEICLSKPKANAP